MTVKSLLNAYGYALVWGIPGALTVFEGLKINGKAAVAAWINKPGSYLVIIGSVLLFFSTCEVLKGLKVTGQYDDTGKIMDLKTAKTLFYVAIFVLLIPVLGFIIASLLFLTMIMKMFQNSFKTIAITVLICFVFMYFVFPQLGLSLPRGMLGI